MLDLSTIEQDIHGHKIGESEEWIVALLMLLDVWCAMNSEAEVSPRYGGLVARFGEAQPPAVRLAHAIWNLTFGGDSRRYESELEELIEQSSTIKLLDAKLLMLNRGKGHAKVEAQELNI